MNETQNNNGDKVTFDYNQLYANNTQPMNTTPQATIPATYTNPIMQETPIVFENEQTKQQNIVTNVIPTFDARALEGEDNNTTMPNEHLINSMKSDAQQEKEQYKKNIIFILTFFGVIMFAILFLFPLLAGY